MFPFDDVIMVWVCPCVKGGFLMEMVPRQYWILQYNPSYMQIFTVALSLCFGKLTRPCGLKWSVYTYQRSLQHKSNKHQKPIKREAWVFFCMGTSQPPGHKWSLSAGGGGGGICFRACLICLLPSGLYHMYWGNHATVPEPVQQSSRTGLHLLTKPSLTSIGIKVWLSRCIHLNIVYICSRRFHWYKICHEWLKKSQSHCHFYLKQCDVSYSLTHALSSTEVNIKTTVKPLI